MSFIKANKYALKGLSAEMFNAVSGRETRMQFKVYEIDGIGYCEHTDDVEAAIDFKFEIVTELPIIELETHKGSK